MNGSAAGVDIGLVRSPAPGPFMLPPDAIPSKRTAAFRERNPEYPSAEPSSRPMGVPGYIPQYIAK